MIVKTLVWENEAATAAFAARLARYWRAHPQDANMLIFLHGDLGAGKTTLTRYILRELGVQGRIKSPTYAVVEPYGLPGLAIWHFDFYRFDDPREWEEAGFRDLFASAGLKLAEWPERAADVLPVADLEVHIQTQADESRLVTCRPRTATGEALLKDAIP